MKKYILLVSISCLFINPSLASTYIPCDETENGTCFSCGETCSMRLTYPTAEDAANNTNATLTLSGEGNMKKYHPDPRPWAGTAGFVTKVVVEEGITSVEYDAFLFFTHITEAQLPSTLNVLAPGAFQGCTSLTTLIIPDGTDIQTASLDGAGLTSLIVPEHANISPDALNWVVGGANSLETIYCSTAQLTKCQAAVAYRDGAVDVKEYIKDDSGGYFYNNKWYSSPNDILNDNHIKKRIYTVDEANKISGKKNTFKIRYK